MSESERPTLVHDDPEVRLLSSLSLEDLSTVKTRPPGEEGIELADDDTAVRPFNRPISLRFGSDLLFHTRDAGRGTPNTTVPAVESRFEKPIARTE